MLLFKLEIGNTIEYAAAESMKDMHERKADIDPQFAFLPVEITEIVIPGHEIVVNELETTDTPDEIVDEDKPKNKGGRPAKVKE